MTSPTMTTMEASSLGVPDFKHSLSCVYGDLFPKHIKQKNLATLGTVRGFPKEVTTKLRPKERKKGTGMLCCIIVHRVSTRLGGWHVVLYHSSQGNYG